MLEIPKKENQSAYSTEVYKLGVEQGDLLLFDSQIPHGVDSIDTDMRISLSFNTFVKGEFGREDNLTFLSL